MIAWLRDHSLSLAIGVIFLVSFAALWVVGWQDFANDARTHGEELTFDAYWLSFWRMVLEGWQGEFLQVLASVLLTKWLIERGSAESNDPPEEQAQ